MTTLYPVLDRGAAVLALVTALATGPANRDEPHHIIAGTASFFGGPDDDDRGNLENLVLPIIYAKPWAVTAARLDTSTPYCAMRWNEWENFRRPERPEQFYSRGLVAQRSVIVMANGRAVAVTPIDYGPNKDTGKLIDLSPSVGRTLGIKSGDRVELALINVETGELEVWEAKP